MKSGGGFTNPPNRLEIVGSSGGTVIIDGNEGLKVTDPDGSSVSVFDENPGSGAVIQAQPADVPGHTFDPAEISTIASAGGAVLNIDGPGIDGISPPSILLESQTSDPKQLIIITADSNLGSQINVATSILTVVRGGTQQFVVNASTGVTSLKTASTVIEGTLGSAWTKPGLSAGWANRGGIFPDMQYRLLAGNQLQLLGEMIPGTLTDGTVIFTLPVGFRPVDPQLVPARKSAGSTAFFLVSSNGQVAIFDGAGSTLIQMIPTTIALDSTT